MFTIIGGDGKEYGPVTTEQIRGWIAGGRANLDTKAKAVGTEDWRRLGDFAEFGGSAEVPPSLTTPVSGSVTATDVPAERLTRLGAALIDRAISLVLAVPGAIVLGTSLLKIIIAASQGREPDLEDLDLPRLILGVSLLGFSWLVLLIVQVWMLTTRGQTIGKRLLAIRVVKKNDGSLPGFLHGWLLRNFVPAVIAVVPYVGFLFVVVDACFIFAADRRCVHDHIAGTRVVKV